MSRNRRLRPALIATVFLLGLGLVGCGGGSPEGSSGIRIVAHGTYSGQPFGRPDDVDVVRLIQTKGELQAALGELKIETTPDDVSFSGRTIVLWTRGSQNPMGPTAPRSVTVTNRIVEFEWDKVCDGPKGPAFVLLSLPGKLEGEYNWLVRHRLPDTSGQFVRVHSSRTWRFQLFRRMPSPLIVTYDTQLAPLADYGPLGVRPETLAELRATPLDTHALLGVLGTENRFDVVQSVWRAGNEGFIAVTSTEQLGPRNAAAISLVEVVMVERAAIRDVDSWTVVPDSDPRLQQCR